MHSKPQDPRGRQYAVQLNRALERKGRTAFVGRGGERIAEALYSPGRFADAVACVLAVGDYYLPFAAKRI